MSEPMGPQAAEQVPASRLAFIGGLHRSGTTALGRVLSAHPDVSGFTGTEAEEDEGQHLQSIYPPASTYGGPGRFARASKAHLGPLSEHEALVAQAGLWQAWQPHWDTGASVLVEKSPPNLIMGRYLQSAFPGSAMIVIIRHPIVVALSTKKWTRFESLPQLVEHWFLAHRVLIEDAAHLHRLHVLRYEDLMASPERELAKIQSFLGLERPIDPGLLDASRSNRYVQAWAEMAEGGALDRRRRARIEERWAAPMAEFGYAADDLTALTDWTLPRPE